MACLFALTGSFWQWVSSVWLRRKMMLFLACVNLTVYNFMGSIHEEEPH